MKVRPVLLVEDDANDVFFFGRAMAAAQSAHPLQVAQDGREATDYLTGAGEYGDRERFPLPCLVLLDLNLPRQHGLEVLQQMRERDPHRHLPVIVLTSSTSERDMQEAYRLGVNSYVNKPPRPNDLVALVRALEGYWLRFNQVPAVQGG